MIVRKRGEMISQLHCPEAAGERYHGHGDRDARFEMKYDMY